MASGENIPTVTLSVLEHEGEKRLFADFSYDRNLIAIVKEVPGARWSQTKRKWHFNLSQQVVESLKQKFAETAVIDASLLKTQWKELEKIEKEKKFANVNEETVKAIDYFKLWMEQKRYSPQTIKNYLGQLLQFFTY